MELDYEKKEDRWIYLRLVSQAARSVEIPFNPKMAHLGNLIMRIHLPADRSVCRYCWWWSP